MYKLFQRHSETLLYLVFGILAVVVNTISYLVLSLCMNDIIANTIAFLITVLFAYWTNVTFVFSSQHTWRKFISFSGMRIATLPIDDLGLATLLRCNVSPFISKCIMNFILIIINYLISRLVIFRDKKGGNGL